MWRRARGLTLTELVLTMAIVGILASVAYPALSHYVRECRRAEARNALICRSDSFCRHNIMPAYQLWVWTPRQITGI